ncbi:MAG: aspartate aminotransferase family protein [Clostridia bacterium]|nr:aspartate aminotransferase family protein [Erysipelotrichia bacterium]NCC87922.1 aspartate aminotransferase family protein [Clostridia bacterium]
MNAFKINDDHYIAHTYQRYHLCIEKGEGVYVYDDANNKYIDFTSGIGVNALGYANQAWCDAISKQASQLAHISNLYYSEPMITLAKKLCDKSGMKKVFFANSGAEANEGAIKIARKYANQKYDYQRNEIITLINSFHGRTMETLSATGQDVFHQYFDPFPTGFKHINANDIEQLKAAINEQTLAIMIEIVQGEGGVIPLERAFCETIQSICDEHDILLIVDEVQTGIGRCGKLFAYEHYHLHPDLVTSAKGLGNGLPIGAILMNQKCEDVLQYGDHGTTFGGNPIACAGANVVLDHMTPSFIQMVEEKGAYMKERLAAMPHVKEVNGLGMMLGVKLDHIDSKQLVNACLRKGALFLTAKANLRLLPPLTMNKQEIDEGLTILEHVLNEWED